MFETNQWLDRTFVYPTAVAYTKVVPENTRNRVHNFLDNLNLPVTFANDLLQGEVDRAGKTFFRFGVNSTLGVAGLWDVAGDFGVERHSEDFGQTLAVWGVPDGQFIMLPALGPSNPRDAFGRAVDSVVLDPFAWVHIKQHIWWQGARIYGTFLDLRSRNLDSLQGIERGSVDYYASVRSLYRQSRAEAIRNGKPDPSELPDF